jgi:hypothetical protein
VSSSLPSAIPQALDKGLHQGKVLRHTKAAECQVESLGILDTVKIYVAYLFLSVQIFGCVN